MAVNFDEVSCLYNIYAIEHIKEALALDWHCKLIVQHIEEDIGGPFIGGSDCKIFDLTHEDDVLPINGTRIQAWFVGCWR